MRAPRPLSSIPLTAAAVLVLAGAAVAAQPAGVAKTTLQEQGFPGPPNHTVLVRTRVAPGAEVAPHTHPGAEMAYVLSGRAQVRIEGQAPRTLGPGGSFSVPPGTPHAVRNAGPGPLTILSTYVVDRGKPIASPARLDPAR
jgi:quercetin dioxygenase-like cupin family protein